MEEKIKNLNQLLCDLEIFAPFFIEIKFLSWI